MRKTISRITLCVLLVLVLCFSVACQTLSGFHTEVANSAAGESATESGSLQFSKLDAKLSQDQITSQIKSDYLVEYKGYKNDDEVVAILTLNGDSLIETFNKKAYLYNKNVGSFAHSEEGIAQQNSLVAQQNSLITKLQKQGLIISVENRYTTVLNAVAVKTKYGMVKFLESYPGISNVSLSETYSRPQAAPSYNVVENLVDVYETGIFNSGSVSYTGVGTAVAVLDSGFDCSHEVFANQPKGPLLITQDDVQGFIDGVRGQSNAVKYTPNLKVSDVYYSDKIPYVYDYADKDPDVFPYDSEHGTHVAGIIGGNSSNVEDGTGKKIKGVAVDTQMVLMKVFSDFKQGAEKTDILEALEDAVLLEVDAINMSLGSSCGFAREGDEEDINRVYDAINASGISLITAASNSYSSGFGGEQGNTNFVTNPDSGTVGSPSTYAAALSVASIDGKKSSYIIATDSNGNNPYTFFYLESSAITGKPNDFFQELYDSLRKTNPNLKDGDQIVLDYITVPGVGIPVNYSAIDVSGKVALISRGDNTFEEKALNAKKHGAIACIIYNNIDGDIHMSMGKTDHIPTVSISKDDGTVLAARKTGKLTICSTNKAGPFMSDFSSWGPSPALELKPDITAHGGNIYSAVPGGGYDELSGTSMATPNLCGIVVLIRQYLKEKFPEKSIKEVSVMANELLMSTAGIALNQEGNPYSPRKQGAGLASLYNAVNTNAYITVDGADRAKLELGDDPDRDGVYKLIFNVDNFSNQTVNYTLSVAGMTESVSTSDNKHVAEKAYMLGGSYSVKVNGVAQNGYEISVPANTSAQLEVVYTLSSADKNYIDSLFPYGMYVEGFVKLASKDTIVTGEGEIKAGIDLNIPFLAFYGDWTEAPLFDKTYYEVESTSHNQAIDDEDKVKADYYATTPYGTYWYNYIIPLGSYLYDVDTNKYDEIPATEDHIAISKDFGAIDGITSVYTGLLRNAKTMKYTITDKVTGEVVYEHIDYNANKAYSNGGSPVPYYDMLNISTYDLGLINNHQYEFKMQGLLDYGDGGVSTNVRNNFVFDFYMDDEAPVIKDVSYEKTYDKTLKKDRYYITLTVYDNHYVQSIMPLIFTGTMDDLGYGSLEEHPIPVYGERNSNTTVRFEVTDYLDDLYADVAIPNALAFSIDDYALNSNIFICQLPGTKGGFKFTTDGQKESAAKTYLTVYAGEVVDLTKYLATLDDSVDENKDYLKYLTWSSTAPAVAEVKDGLLCCHKTGLTTINVCERYDGREANIVVRVKAKGDTHSDNLVVEDVSTTTIQKLRFAYYDTVFAYAKSSQRLDIGEEGNRDFLQPSSVIRMYPGERVQLSFDFDPWYAMENYELTWSSDRTNKATVSETGEVTAQAEGSAKISLVAVDKRTGRESNIRATVNIEIKNPFIIEDRILVAYKGWGGEVVIPDDEGILYIGSYAFCLYETDNHIKIDEDDWDRNKTPKSNSTITSVIIPYGVEEIQKYAFYNCSALESVSIPSTCKFIRENAFNLDINFTTIKTTDDPEKGLEGTKVQTIGANAFAGCVKLENINLSNVFAIGVRAFDNCVSLQTVDLTALRNTGKEAFRGCTALTSVTMNDKGDTKLSVGMFTASGLQSVDIYERVDIPANCFKNCTSLATVNIHNSLVSVGDSAFQDCTALQTLTWADGITVDRLGKEAFAGVSAMTSFTMPNSNVSLGDYCFYGCTNLEEIVLGKNTVMENIGGCIFVESGLETFTVDADNQAYSVDAVNSLLLNKAGNTVIFAALGKDYSASPLVLNYANIGASAFSGVNVQEVEFTCAVNIGKAAFASCEDLDTLTFATDAGTVIGESAFRYCKLSTINNLDAVKTVGEYAFAGVQTADVTIGSNATYGEGAFFQSKLQSATIGANTTLGLGVFQGCTLLETVNMPAEGGVHFGVACFSGAKQLKNIDLSKIDNTLENETFLGCIALQVADLQTVETIGNYAFADCSKLTTVNMPVVKTIGNSAFSRADDKEDLSPVFTAITLPETLTSIGDSAFLGCQNLASISIPSGVTTIPNYAFAFCAGLEEVQLASSVTTIGKWAFYRCEMLDTINLENVREIGEYAFRNTSELTSIDLSAVQNVGEAAFESSGVSNQVVANNLVTLGDYAFQNANVASFTANSLKQIGYASFKNNKALQKFVISKQLTKIDDDAFVGCSQLASFYFLDGDNHEVNNGKINDYALLDNGILYTTMQSGALQLTSVPAAMVLEENTLVVLEGAQKVAEYAGNENKTITKIVLPDSMKLVCNYAFYGYTSLETVEFRSFTAPAFDNFYDSKAQLSESDPGYELLHKAVALGGWEICYFNFVDLLGKNKPLQMIVPANNGIIGYDSLVFEVYFGKLSDAERSTYVARDKNLVDFYEYAQRVAALKVVTMVDATLINNAVTAYNAIPADQNPVDYGYSADEWQTLVDKVMKAKADLRVLQLANASKAAQNVQRDIDALPSTFNISDMAMLADLSTRLYKLTPAERLLLDMTKYNELQAALAAYNANLTAEVAGIKAAADNSYSVAAVATAALALAGAAIVIKRRFM